MLQLIKLRLRKFELQLRSRIALSQFARQLSLDKRRICRVSSHPWIFAAFITVRAARGPCGAAGRGLRRRSAWPRLHHLKLAGDVKGCTGGGAAPGMRRLRRRLHGLQIRRRREWLQRIRCHRRRDAARHVWNRNGLRCSRHIRNRGRLRLPVKGQRINRRRLRTSGR